MSPEERSRFVAVVEAELPSTLDYGATATRREVAEAIVDALPELEAGLRARRPLPEWPEWLSPESNAMHTAVENEIKRALQHCFDSADASGLSWTTEGWVSCSASNVLSLLKRLGCPPPPVGEVERMRMPREECWDEDEYETVPPNERAVLLLANVRERMDDYGDLANADADALRDALRIAAETLNGLAERAGDQP